MSAAVVRPPSDARYATSTDMTRHWPSTTITLLPGAFPPGISHDGLLRWAMKPSVGLYSSILRGKAGQHRSGLDRQLNCSRDRYT
jgi:hypothetical protein